jgi:hypothetical protein
MRVSGLALPNLVFVLTVACGGQVVVPDRLDAEPSGDTAVEATGDAASGDASDVGRDTAEGRADTSVLPRCSLPEGEWCTGIGAGTCQKGFCCDGSFDGVHCTCGAGSGCDLWHVCCPDPACPSGSCTPECRIPEKCTSTR